MARRKIRAALICVPASLLVLSACGASDAGSSGSDKGTADVAGAKSIIAPYIGQPSKFPITEALKTKPTGKKLAYMDCGTPICGLFFTLAEPAAKSLGMSLTRIKTGQAADTVSSAFDTAVEGNFDGVFVPAIAPALWERGLDALKAKGIPVVTTGVTGGDPKKIDVQQVSDTNVKEAGKLVAAYVVAKHDTDVNAVVYVTPELPFNQVFADSYEAEVKKLCGSCETRFAKIPVATLGNRAPSLITDDLQAHPDTKTVVFAVGEQANGLAAAMKTAGLKSEIIANSPSPETLSQIQSGDIEAGLGLDIPVIAWTAVDSLARLVTGAEADPGAKADIPPMQFLTKADLKGDVSKGWTGYPDFGQRFTALWKDAS
jgi:ribose transport system substrate-binding protein